MEYGYMGKILVVDLSKGTTSAIPTSGSLREKLVGGKGFGARLLFDLVPAGADPLGPDNVLMFMPGPLTGTNAPAMRGCAVAKSPLTGTFVDSYHGGHFAQEIKYAGYDGLVFRGRAPEPVYAVIRDERVEIRPATHLWGKDTFETNRAVKAELGDPTAKVACIGPAGENLVRFALISAEYNRHAGRGGCGAVMGSKNLKAVAIIGTRAVAVRDPAGFRAAVDQALAELRESAAIQGFTSDGTPASIPFANAEGLLPCRNYGQGTFEGSGGIDNEAQKAGLWLRDWACASCPIACGKMGVIRRGKHAGMVSDVVEYETAAMMGANLGIGALDDVTYLVKRCDALGLDGMSAGGVLGFAVEAMEKGALTLKQAGGRALQFGDARALGALLEEVASRSSELGNILAEGVNRAAAVLGGGSDSYAVHVKGLESPAWGPRGAPGMGLAYMTGDRGGCHQRAFPILYEVGGEPWKGHLVDRLGLDEKAEILIYLQNRLAGLDALVKCDFAAYGITTPTYARMLETATGTPCGEEDILTLGERIWNLIRLYNYREGFRRADDRLPRRFVAEALPDGPAAGHMISEDDCRRLLDDYYALRGWDAEGRPTPETVRRLGLD